MDFNYHWSSWYQGFQKLYHALCIIPELGSVFSWDRIIDFKDWERQSWKLQRQSWKLQSIDTKGN